MSRGFLQAVHYLGGTAALGISGFLLGMLALPVKSVTLEPEGLKDGSHGSDFVLAQGIRPELNLDFQISLLPPLSTDENLGPAFADLQLLPDLFLPRYPSFNSQLLDQQLILYSIHLFLSGPPDVLIVGSSRAIQGVDPKTLTQTLVAQGHTELDIYNFSINGATAQVIDLLLREILTPDQLPKLVVWADGSRAFNDGRPDRTYEQISESEGFQQLANGMNPILVHSIDDSSSSCQDQFGPQLSYTQSAPAQSAPVASFAMASTLGWLNASILPFTQTWSKARNPYPVVAEQPCETNLTATSFFKSSSSSFFQHSPVATADVSAAPNSSFNYDNINYQSPALDPSITSLQQFVSQLPFDLDTNGFLPNSTEFEPTTYYQQFPYVAGDYDANYVPFQLQGVQTDATHRLARAMNNKQIPLAFVNLPLTQDYLDATRTAYESQFVQHMQQISQQSGFMFVDLNQPDLAKNQYFADPSHLNAQGARAVATQLAIQNGIPWPK